MSTTQGTKTATRLRGPMLIPPGEFLNATENLQPREVGALALIAAAFWERGDLPTGADLGACLGVRTSRAEALLPTLRPFFEPGGFVFLMRAAAVAKSTRRAKAGRLGAAALHKKGAARSGRPEGRT